jgi:malate-CoA ligase subunit beta
MDVRIPVVARLAGTNLDEGDRILRDSGLPVVRAADLGEAARKAVEAAAATAT